MLPELAEEEEAEGVEQGRAGGEPHVGIVESIGRMKGGHREEKAARRACSA